MVLKISHLLPKWVIYISVEPLPRGSRCLSVAKPFCVLAEDSGPQGTEVELTHSTTLYRIQDYNSCESCVRAFAEAMAVDKNRDSPATSNFK